MRKRHCCRNRCLNSLMGSRQQRVSSNPCLPILHHRRIGRPSNHHCQHSCLGMVQMVGSLIRNIRSRRDKRRWRTAHADCSLTGTARLSHNRGPQTQVGKGKRHACRSRALPRYSCWGTVGQRCPQCMPAHQTLANIDTDQQGICRGSCTFAGTSDARSNRRLYNQGCNSNDRWHILHCRSSRWYNGVAWHNPDLSILAHMHTNPCGTCHVPNNWMDTRVSLHMRGRQIQARSSRPLAHRAHAQSNHQGTRGPRSNSHHQSPDYRSKCRVGRLLGLSTCPRRLAPQHNPRLPIRGRSSTPHGHRVRARSSWPCNGLPAHSHTR